MNIKLLHNKNFLRAITFSIKIKNVLIHIFYYFMYISLIKSFKSVCLKAKRKQQRVIPISSGNHCCIFY